MHYIGEKPLASNHAGNKARIDIDSVLEQKYGKCILNIDQISYKNILEKIKWTINIDNIKMLLKIRLIKNKIIILQYPFYFNLFIRKALSKLGIHNKEILIVHDVDALRSMGNQSLDEDIADMNKAVAVVLHNQKMIDALQKLGLKTPAVNLELFDYLLDGELPKQNYKLGNTIAFAGNLEKSTFLKDKCFENLLLNFNLYGPNFDKEKISWNNVTYKGSFKPNEIPYYLEGSFGLIWDGNVLDTCSGAYGEYMKYNNPHKLSLYIAAGLPVVVWEKAAIADFVKKYNIGIIVKSLLDLDKEINSLSEEQYEEFKQNILVLQKNVTNGYYTRRALNICEKIISEKGINDV